MNHRLFHDFKNGRVVANEDAERVNISEPNEPTISSMILRKVRI